jgi:Phage integrase, N-terminal SAM-like domain
MSTEKREVLGENLCRAPRLLDRVRGKLRVKNYSIRTEEGYVNWITRFILFHNKSLILQVRLLDGVESG